MKRLVIFKAILVLLLSASCDKNEDQQDSLIVNTNEIVFAPEGGSESIQIQTSAKSWRIQNPTDWISASPASGSGSNVTVVLGVSSKVAEARTETLTIIAGSAEPQHINVSQQATEFLYQLSTDTTSLEFYRKSRSDIVTVTTNAPEWQITTDADWIDIGTESGTSGTSTIRITVTENSAGADREAIATLTAPSAEPVEISILQNEAFYPSYNIVPIDPDQSGMTKTATELAADMTVGWNIGNTLEAIGGETAWGNPEVSPQLIELVKSQGINAIRIPCAWNQYMANETTAELQSEWLDRVKEVVSYCVERDMYAILNIHWDGGWLENNITVEKQEENNAKQKAFWEQIATELRDFDEHLLFAGTNEPNVEDAEQMEVLNSYLQTFVDAVRATGGRNSYRTLIFQGPSTDIDKTDNLMTSLPTDEVADRLMAEVHYYTPYQFCLMTEDAEWGNMFYYWGENYHSSENPERNADWGEEEALDELFGKMKTKFVDQGIPVIIGEYAVIKRTFLEGEALDLHLASRAYFLKYATEKAKSLGMVPFYWDAGNKGTNSSALFDRQNNTVYDQQALDALLEGAGL